MPMVTNARLNDKNQVDQIFNRASLNVCPLLGFFPGQCFVPVAPCAIGLGKPMCARNNICSVRAYDRAAKPVSDNYFIAVRAIVDVLTYRYQLVSRTGAIDVTPLAKYEPGL